MKLVGSKRAVRSPEFHKRKELERKLRLGLFALLASAVIVLPTYFLGSEALQVRKVFVQGNLVTTSIDIERMVRESLVGEYLGLIPRSSTILLSKNIIEQRLLESVPRLASVHLSREGLSGVSVDVVERVPKALYCTDECYFLDGEGYIYSEAPNFVGEAYLEYRDESLPTAPVGSYFLPKEDFEELHNFVESFRSLNLNPKMVMKSGDVYKVILEGDVEVRWRDDQDISKLFVDLSSFINDGQLKNLKIEDLLYLDLSFNNKVHWVYKDGR